MPFSQLTTEIQESFLSYEFSVVILEGATDQDVLEIFARLNTYAQKLTYQELLNAAYFGQFKQTVYSLGLEHLEFWRGNGILQDRQIVRMAEAELVSELLVTMLAGIQHRKGKIKEFYEKYDDEFPQAERVQREFKSIIDIIAECFGPRLKGSIYSGRAMFHSLFCAFYHVKYGIPETPELGIGGKLHQIISSEIIRIRESLSTLENKYKRVPPPEEVIRFIEASQKATADKTQRIVRTKTIVDYIDRAIEY